MARTQEKLPEWMLRLENKRKKQHRLAHDIGAGAPCFICEDRCPGLDLHFWRKLCRNCKCKKEDHDVKDDEGYEQFEILLGSDRRKTKKGGYLNIKVSEDTHSPIKPVVNSNKGVAFDWIPPNVSDDVAAEYMSQLPASKLPISGSDGALYRRQQLEKQVPLHDLNAEHCHNLTSQEIEGLMKYLENLKNNVVGLGCVGKVPVLYSETRVPLLGPIGQQARNEALARPLVSSQSADPIRPLPPMPPAYNYAPRPFHASTPSSAYGSGEEDDMPPALPSSLPPRADLRTPSEFIDWRLPDDRSSSLGKINQGMQNMHINIGVPPQLVSEPFNQSLTNSNALLKQPPQLSGKLSPPQCSIQSSNQYNSTGASLAVSQDVGLATQQYSSILGDDLKESGVAQSSSLVPQSGTSCMQRRLHGQEALVSNIKDSEYSTMEALSGASHLSGLPLDAITVPSYTDQRPSSSDTVSASVNPPRMAQVSKPLGSEVNALNNARESFSHVGSVTTNVVPAEVPGVAVPMGAKNQSGTASNTGGGGVWNLSKDPSIVHPIDSKLSSGAMQGIAHSESVAGKRGIAQNLGGRRGDGPASLSLEMQYGSLGGSALDESVALPIDGVVTSNITHPSIIQSNSVGTDALPKSAEVLKQQPHALDVSQTVASTGSSGPLPEGHSHSGSTAHLGCQECGEKLMAGDVAVFAERAESAAWHPKCFVCTTCKELLVDLMYFYHENNVYCGRHYAELLGIPRCFACDELIFVKEYTVAEGKCFHIKHFCCYECDSPLAGKQYIPVEDQPVCLDCYDRIYGKKCHTCKNKIAPSQQRVGWKDLNWHVQGNCFCCYECAKSLLGGRFVVKENQPFCSKECVQAGLLKLSV